MAYNVFYSWQSRKEGKYTRNFIEECLKTAIKQVKKELSDSRPEVIIDRADRNAAGMHVVVATLEEKISKSDLFVADVTYTSYSETNEKQPRRTLWEKIFGLNKFVKEGVPNTNVIEELGIAEGNYKGAARIITVLNTVYGSPDDLPFDLRPKRYPIRYRYDNKTTTEQKAKEKEQLINELKRRIKEIILNEQARRKDYYHPFEVWKSWERTLLRTVPFEKTDYLNEKFVEIISNIKNPKVIFRVCGLSGIGKTRILFECFNPEQNPDVSQFTQKLLYVDSNDFDDNVILNSAKALLQNNEDKILIIDNCSQDLHNNVSKLIINENSKLSLISVSSSPDEKANQLHAPSEVRMMQLENQECKKVVKQILTKSNLGLNAEEIDLLVDFSSGLALVADLMANNNERNKYEPGSLTREEVVRRLLSRLYEDEQSRAAILACCLFSKFGFFDDLEYQTDAIASSPDLFPISFTGANPADIPQLRINKFKQVCKELYERKLLEKRGRTFLFRPSPLAVRLAEDWWNNCTDEKFKRILPILEQSALTESFSEQFRFLKHVENAKTVVTNLCNNFFKSAEILNSQVGSRIFRSFILIEPTVSSKTLYEVFTTLSLEELKNFTQGRRNIVWGLEQLCSRKETFALSIKALAALAVGETENIGNNATHQFLQLFHIHLPGTSATLQDRLDIIHYCLGLDEEYKRLGLRAISSAFMARGFGRMGIPEEYVGLPFKDHNPSGTEVFNYWKELILTAKAWALKEGPNQLLACEILLDNFFSLSKHNMIEVYLPVISELLEKDLLKRMDVRKQAQGVARSLQTLNPEIRVEVKQFYESLKPLNFEEQFKTYIEKPSPEEYRDEETGGRDATELENHINKVAQSFIEEPDEWDNRMVLFMQPTIAEGRRFGQAIAKNYTGSKSELIQAFLKALKKADPNNRNLAVFLSFLADIDDIELVRKTFIDVLKDEEIKSVAFAFARSINLPAEDIQLVIEKTKHGEFTSFHFQEFLYGWGIRHLTHDEILKIFENIIPIDASAPAIAFFILTTWVSNDEELFKEYKDIIRDLLLKYSSSILSHSRQTMDLYYFDFSAQKFLDTGIDNEMADRILELIFEESKDFATFHWKEHSFASLLNIIQDKYFDLFWKKLSDLYLHRDQNGMTAFNLKDILKSRNDYRAQPIGMLFRGDRSRFEKIFEWCKIHRHERALYDIGAVVPILNGARNADNEWHPYALEFINEFGNDKRFLSEIAAQIGTYSWTGSVVPKLKSDKALFKALLNHPVAQVKSWAAEHFDYTERRIKEETDRDEEGW